MESARCASHGESQIVTVRWQEGAAAVTRDRTSQDLSAVLKDLPRPPADAESREFVDLIAVIEQARVNAFRAVNRELISMYSEIGRLISERTASDGWGKATIARFSQQVQRRFPGINGFSPVNIWRMRTFYEAYQGNENLSALTKEVSWTSNIMILSAAKTDEAKEFYLVLAAKYHYSSRELQRQLDAMLFERTMLSDQHTAALVEKHPELAALRDSYVLEFLDLPADHAESDLRRAIVANLRDFILEFGKDFTFVGEEYRVQVGTHDYRIDLLLFQRELACLVAIELKIGEFKPEYVGQLDFYLEALDRDVRKPNEQPSVGLILCAGADDEVVDHRPHAAHARIVAVGVHDRTVAHDVVEHDHRACPLKILPSALGVHRSLRQVLLLVHRSPVELWPLGLCLAGALLSPRNFAAVPAQSSSSGTALSTKAA